MQKWNISIDSLISKLLAYFVVRGLLVVVSNLLIPTTFLSLLQTVLFSFLFLSQGTSRTCNNIAGVNFLAV